MFSDYGFKGDRISDFPIDSMHGSYNSAALPVIGGIVSLTHTDRVLRLQHQKLSIFSDAFKC